MSAPGVFISYAREDETKARDIHKRLLNAGFEPWLDRIDLIGGEDWDRAIRRALRKADFVVLCMSEASTSKRGYLQRELKMAVDLWQEMVRGDIYLLPLRLEECEVPEELAYLQWIDLFDTDGWSRLLKALESGIERRNGKAHATTPMPSAGSPDGMDAAAGDSPPARPVSVRPSVGSLVPNLPLDVTRRDRFQGHLRAFATIPPRWFLIAACIVLATGNLLLWIGHSDRLLSFLFHSFGFRALRNIDLVMRSTTLVILIAGYFFLLVWMTRIWLPRQGSRRLASAGLPVRLAPCLVVLLLAAANVVVAAPDRAALARVLSQNVVQFAQGWTDRLLGWQAPSGGITSELTGQRRTQVWTTAQALNGIVTAIHYGYSRPDPDAVWRAFEHIESERSALSNDGWAYWDDHSRTVTEVNAWVTVATARALHTPDALPGPVAVATLEERIQRDLQELLDRQQPGGGWSPIKEASSPSDTRTYSTVMAVWALLEGRRVEGLETPSRAELDEGLRSGARWLLANRHPTMDWVPNPGRKDAQTETFRGLTAQSIFVLSRMAEERVGAFLRNDAGFLEVKRRFLSQFGPGLGPPSTLDTRTPDGDVHLSATDFVLEGSTYLGFPWTLAAMSSLAHDEQLSPMYRGLARQHWVTMALRADEVNQHVLASWPYVTAENLFAIAEAAANAPWRRPEPERNGGAG